MGRDRSTGRQHALPC